ncbi:unnamed protein product [Ilex paraguariensis]|uniref:O-methyltransferase C-terminal domain-containing protein n=1 Tax=Ilex paraguariensis TaxID=185542 RepID=A0ABC8TQ80_9AQUA
MANVGGGTRAVEKAIANAFPDLECTVFDLPHVVAGLEGNKNLSYAVGDTFEAIPTTDAVLLKVGSEFLFICIGLVELFPHGV